MGGEWREMTWGDIATLEYGRALRGHAKSSGQFRVFGTNGPIGWHDESLCPHPTVVIGRKGAYRGVHFSPAPCFVIDTAFYLEPKNDLDVRWAYYQLLTQDINAMDSGSAIPSTSRDEFYNLVVYVPPLPEQRAIAHILGTLDDRIELNRRMSETLEAMARALFKSWFIDFDPVRRNMEKRRGQNQPSPPAPLPGGEGRRANYRGGYDFAGLLKTARELREKQTPAEAIFWDLVRDRRLLGLKFRRQHQLGDYVADFYCHEHRLVIEFDGGVHSEKKRKDHKRDAWMKAQGIRVLRFPNKQLLNEPESILTTIAQVVEATAKTLPLAAGRGAGIPPSPFGRRAGDEGVVESTAFDHLFPARLVDSELGEIPEGWEVASLPDLVEINPPRLLRKGEIAPYLDMANMPTRGHAPYEVVDRPFGSGMRFINGDTLVARITPCLENGKTAFVDFLPLRQVGWGSTEYIVLRPRPPLPEEFAYCLARSDAFREFAIQSMTGTSGRQRVQADSLKHFRLPRVPAPIAEAFGRAIRSLFARSSAAVRESLTLAALRDTLLPKLISGELRVKDAERFLKERGL